jgi:transposase, IS5 family
MGRRAAGHAFSAAKAMVKRVCNPDRSTKSTERKREQKQRVVKRQHGLTRCRYKGDRGMKRWVGLAVIADNLISMFTAMACKTQP